MFYSPGEGPVPFTYSAEAVSSNEAFGMAPVDFFCLAVPPLHP